MEPIQLSDGGRLTATHLIASSYAMTREQADQVFNGTADQVVAQHHCDMEDCNSKGVVNEFMVRRRPGSQYPISIGCVDFSTEDVAKAQEWLKAPAQETQDPAQAQATATAHSNPTDRLS